MKAKLHTEKGFSLAEVLVAILILLMVSTIVATGIPVARNAYEKVVLASNAEVLLSTTVSTLRNELGTAKDIVIPSTEGEGIKNNSEIRYYNGTRGNTSRIYVKTDGNIMFERYFFDPDEYTLAEGFDPPGPERLISDSTATQDLHVTYESVSYSGGIITFTNLVVYHDGTVLARREPLSIRIISA